MPALTTNGPEGLTVRGSGALPHGESRPHSAFLRNGRRVGSPSDAERSISRMAFSLKLRFLSLALKPRAGFANRPCMLSICV